MVPQYPHDNPPRLPLRVRVSARLSTADGTDISATAWRVLEPDEPEYDRAYIIAVGTHRLYGWDMPYAHASDEDRG